MVFHSFPFTFQFSSLKSAGSTEFWISAFRRIDHHILSNFVPLSVGFAYESSVPFLLRSTPWKWPMSSHEFSSIFSNSVSIRNTIFIVSSFFPINVIVDMKMILPCKCLGSHINSVIIFWISSRTPNVVNPEKFFHSNSIGSPSIRSNTLKERDSTKHLIFLSQALTGSGLMRPRHSTESEKTQVSAVAHWTALSVSRVVSLSSNELLPISRSNTSNFSLVSDQLLSHLKQLSERFLGLIPGRTQLLRVVCTKMTCSLKSDGHEYSPYSCVQIESFSFCLSDWDHIFVSQLRKPSPCAVRSL